MRKPGSNEVGSALLKYIRALPSYVKHLSLYSTCGGQNRSVNIAALMLHVVSGSGTLKTIDQKSLEPGHTYMEVDSMHAIIERAKEFQKIYTPDFWIPIISSACRTKPYNIELMAQDDIYDLKPLASVTVNNRVNNIPREKVPWMSIKWLRYS